MKNLFILAFSVALLSSTAASAQVATTSSSAAGGEPLALQSGTKGISLGIVGGNPFATGTAGFHYFFTSNLVGGLSLGLRIEDGGDQVAGLGAGPPGGDWGLLIAPNIRYFFNTGHRVLPFIIGKLNLAAWEDDADADDDSEAYLGLGFGLGAEFFPYHYFSIGGHIGLNLNMVQDFGLGLLTSAAHVNFYF